MGGEWMNCAPMFPPSKRIFHRGDNQPQHTQSPKCSNLLSSDSVIWKFVYWPFFGSGSFYLLTLQAHLWIMSNYECSIHFLQVMCTICNVLKTWMKIKDTGNILFVITSYKMHVFFSYSCRQSFNAFSILRKTMHFKQFSCVCGKKVRASTLPIYFMHSLQSTIQSTGTLNWVV
jgi:hypothetical protein